MGAGKGDVGREGIMREGFSFLALHTELYPAHLLYDLVKWAVGREQAAELDQGTCLSSCEVQ